MILRRLGAEALGTALLLAAIVGSGIMAVNLAGGNNAIALLANTLSTATMLGCLILIFSPVSGAHFNPAVTFAQWWGGVMGARDSLAYVVAQILGAVIGVVAAHAMFDLPLLTPSATPRAGTGQSFSEFIATFGLLMVIFGCSRYRPGAMPVAVAAYIASAYWFTASTSFANPAVTLGRTLTASFSGIAPEHAAAFILAQLAGAVAALALKCFFFR